MKSDGIYIDKIQILLEKSIPYLWPWFLLPLAFIYFLDFAALLILLIQGFCAGFLVLNTMAIGLGIFLGVMDRFEPKFEWLPNSKLSIIFVGLKYGYSFSNWLLSDIKNK